MKNARKPTASLGLCILAVLLARIALLPPAARAEVMREPTADQSAVNVVLDDFHAAAAEADTARYLANFSEGAVFLGTDDWERWPLPEFKQYVTERFSESGWTYIPRTRETTVDGDVAWFDEIVESPRWGRFRGTGVLRRVDNEMTAVSI